MPWSRASSKSAPTPNVVVDTPRARSSAACLASSTGSVRPLLASPSVRTRQRFTPSAARCVATCSAPRNQPSDRFVLPRASTASEPGHRVPPRLRRTGRALDDEIDHVVVHDDAEPIAPVEVLEGGRDRPLGELDLLARHRARPIEHEREVDRQPIPFAGRGRRGDLDEDEALAPMIRPDEAPIGAGGNGGVGHDGSSSRRSRAIETSRSTCLESGRGSGRRT